MDRRRLLHQGKPFPNAEQLFGALHGIPRGDVRPMSVRSSENDAMAGMAEKLGVRGRIGLALVRHLHHRRVFAEWAAVPMVAEALNGPSLGHMAVGAALSVAAAGAAAIPHKVVRDAVGSRTRMMRTGRAQGESISGGSNRLLGRGLGE